MMKYDLCIYAYKIFDVCYMGDKESPLTPEPFSGKIIKEELSL